MVFKTVEEQAEYQAKLREKEKAAEQEALDEEMRKRRERVKAWQQAKASSTNGNPTSNDQSQSIESETAAQIPVVDSTVMSVESDADVIPTEGTTIQQPKWSLEDEGDDDDEEGAEGEANHLPTSTTTQIPPPFNTIPTASSGPEPPPLLAPLAPLVEHKQIDEEDDDVEATVFINPKKSLSSSGTHKPIKFSSSTTTTTPSKAIPTTNTTAPSEKPKPKLSDLSPIRTKSTTTPTNSNPVSTPLQSTTSSSLPAAVDEEEEDPLDAFMKSLYSDPGIPQDPDARSVSSSYTYTETNNSNTKPSSNGGIAGPASLSSRIRALDADPAVARSILRNSIPTSNTTTNTTTNNINNKNGKSNKNKEVINPFGSNFITLEDIMKSTTTSNTTSTATAVTGENGNLAITTTQGAYGSGSSSGVRRKAGWESDVPSSPFIDSGHQGEEAEDEKEEIARREFMEALHKAATASTTTLTPTLPTATTSIATAAATTTTTLTNKEQQGDNQLGRIFANDGDLIDDTTITTQKQKSALEILEESKKGKELKAVDHSLIQYIPIRKNLYIVPKILSKMTEQEIREKRENLHIKVRGKLCPIPVDSWEQCGLSDRILQVLDKLQLKEPFAIQKQAIPAIMCGRDVIAIAKTGSGRCIL